MTDLSDYIRHNRPAEEARSLELHRLRAKLKSIEDNVTPALIVARAHYDLSPSLVVRSSFRTIRGRSIWRATCPTTPSAGTPDTEQHVADTCRLSRSVAQALI